MHVQCEIIDIEDFVEEISTISEMTRILSIVFNQPTMLNMIPPPPDDGHTPLPPYHCTDGLFSRQIKIRKEFNFCYKLIF